jgi:DNA-binding CsgD family transcriptional regulator
MHLEHADIAPDIAGKVEPPDRLDSYLSRLHRLTPREVRLLILIVQDGLSYREITDVLGITRGNVATTMQTIRRKLAVPRMQDLGTFVRANEMLAAALIDQHPKTPPVGPKQLEQRRKDLLRMTVEELMAVAARARRRAVALERLAVDDDETTPFGDEEARRLHEVADLADFAATQALAVARRDENENEPAHVRP